MRIDTFCPPVNDDLLRRHNFFELYPFDGGGCFIHREIVGTIDDDEIFDRIVKKSALGDFGQLPHLNFSKFERWRTIEKSCWMNRCYFLAPLAKKYWLTKDESIALLVKETILHFIANYRPPATKEEVGEHQKRVFWNRDHNYNSKSFDEYSKDETDVEYIWFDFQPASRIIHFLYAMHFLKDSPSVSPEDWSAFEKSIQEHARVIMIGEKYFDELAPGNHQSLRGLALLFAAAFLAGTEDGKIFEEEGLRICDYHVRYDYFNDGVLREVSPSYHMFETWHMRDAFLLSRQYGFNLCPEAQEVLAKAGLFARSLAQPDGRSTVINDGYALQLDAFIASLPVTTGKAGDGASAFFNDAGLAFFRDEARYLMVDASPFTGSFSHYHSGKNALTYWHTSKPFLIDSACCSYDDPLFAQWYKKSDAHSTLLVEGHGDSCLKGTYEWLASASVKCDGWSRSKGKRRLSSTLSSPAAGWEGVLWRREIELEEKNGVALVDKVTTSKIGTALDFIFNLHPDVKPELAGKCVLLKNGGVTLRMSFDSETPFGIALLAGRAFIDFKHSDCVRICVSLKTAPNETVLLTRILEA